MPTRIEDIYYRVDWRAGFGLLPGAHPGTLTGSGGDFTRHVPLYEEPEPRRLDVRASLSDPWRRFLVRSTRQKATVPVYVLADLSASMGYQGYYRKLDALADLTASLAWSAQRAGDPFGFIGCNQSVHRQTLLPLTRAARTGIEIAKQLRAIDVGSAGGPAFVEGANLVSGKRSLVFLVSDFYFPLDLLADALKALSRHRVVPVMLSDTAAQTPPAKVGLSWLRDVESKRSRLVVLRARSGESFSHQFSKHLDGVRALTEAAGYPLLGLDHGFEARRLNRYFQG